MKDIQTNYYTLQGGMGYKTFLEHFKQQAEGQRQFGFILAPGVNRKKYARLRLVKMATDTTATDMPKVEVVDPNEALKNRASSELKRDRGDITGASGDVAQSAARRRRRNKAENNSQSSKVVKRARDIFDK
jgi:hypothetical protein